jgi:hypothetical protein
MSFNNILTGYKVSAQIPLDAKANVANEAVLRSLGLNNRLAYTYEKGLTIYCQEEGTRYEWREVTSNDEIPGLLIGGNFTYPSNWIVAGVTYSNKVYNFFPGGSIVPNLEQVLAQGNTSLYSRIKLGATSQINAELDKGYLLFRDPNLSTLIVYQSNGIINYNGVFNNTFLQLPVKPLNNVTFVTPLKNTGTYTLATTIDIPTVPVIGISGAGGTTVTGTYPNFVITSTASSTTPDATDLVKGKLRLTGDLGGTADAPTTPTAVHITGNETVDGVKTFISRVDYKHSALATIGLSIQTGLSNSKTFTKLIFNEEADVLNVIQTLENSVTGHLGHVTLKSKSFGLASFSTNNIPVNETRLYTLPFASGTLALDEVLQKIITYPTNFVGSTYTVTNADSKYTLLINNGATNVNIEVPFNLTKSIVSYIQQGTGDVTFTSSSGLITTPIPGAFKIKGQYYQAQTKQKHFSSEFYLLGDIKI